MKVLHKTLLLSLACAAASPALAYEAGDIMLRVGVAQVTPDVSTDAALAGVDVDSDIQLGLTATYMVTPKFGVELLGATPFKHDITAGGATIGSTKQLPPTVTAQFYPLDNATVQPYVGAGINYTHFWGEDLGGAGLTDSVGLAVEAGVDIKVANNLYLNAAVWKIDINTDLETSAGAKVGEVQIDPLAAMIAIGYKF